MPTTLPTASTTSSIDYRYKWAVMITMTMSLLLEVIDISIVNVTLPTIVTELETSFATVQWVLLAPMLTQTSLMLSVGRLGDMIGKKPIFLSGLGVFMLGAIAASLAPTIGWLIAFRTAQAVGGAMVTGLTFAIVTEAFPPQERGKAVGLISLVVSVGIILGPILGGFVIDVFSWRWTFVLGIPLGIMGIILGLRFIPASTQMQRQRFDYSGALTFCLTLLTFLLALTMGQDRGYAHPLILALLSGTLIFLSLFIWLEYHTAEPMIDLRLFQNLLLSSSLVVRVLSFVAQSGLLILLPFYLQNVLGYSPRAYGPLLIVTPIGLGLFAPISGMLSDRFGSLRISVLGLSIILIGYLATSTLDSDTTTLGYILRLSPIGIGMGFFQSPNNSAIMGAVPRDRTGIASGLVAITRTLGSTTGVAILGALWSIRTSVHAGQRLAGGVTTAPIAAQMVGLQDTFLVTAGIITLGLVLTILMLRYLKGAENIAARL